VKTGGFSSASFSGWNFFSKGKRKNTKYKRACSFLIFNLLSFILPYRLP
jgi:hypothetical protein